MNLFYNPTLSDLASLVKQSCNGNESFNLLVDYDGEVIIDLSTEKPDSLLAKYKFYIKELKNWNHMNIERRAKQKSLIQMFRALIYCWNKDVSGKVDLHQIANLHNELQNGKRKTGHEDSIPISINVRM